MLQVQTSRSSVSNNSSRQSEPNRLSNRLRNYATTTSKSLSTVTTDARSFQAPRTHAGSLPTFSSSVATPRTSSAPAPQYFRETARHDVSAKKMKVEVDLTENDADDFENDLDAEMMLLMAQTTELENYTQSSSCSSIDNRRRADVNSRLNVRSANSAVTNSCHVSRAIDRTQRHITETTSHTALDSGINSSTVSCNITGSRQSANSDKCCSTGRDLMGVKHCATDRNVRDVKHSSVVSKSSVNDNASCFSASVAMTTSSASSGSVDQLGLCYF